jgi:hypothetical protein
MVHWFTLDSNFRSTQMIESFNSFIWTERYSAYGDFQIVTKSTFPSRQLLTPETWIGCSESQYLMKIDTVTDAVDDSGNRNLTVTGKSMEALLLDRAAMQSLTPTATIPAWLLEGTPGNIARYLFDQICVACVLDPSDAIDFYVAGSFNQPGNLVEPTDFVTVSISPTTLYDALQAICNPYTIGFRLIRRGNLSQVFFEIYVGNDLTSKQTKLKPVIFDPNMESLVDQTLVKSTAVVKTVAYVIAQNGTAVVYAPNANPQTAGFQRRVLLVNSSNTDPAGAVLQAALNQEGVSALAVQTPTYMFDGTLPPSSPYKYGRDYKLGDLIEERDDAGTSNQMVVTEQIFSSDDTGEKSYPTLTQLQTITPGSWAAWTPPDQVWSGVDPSVHWGDL